MSGESGNESKEYVCKICGKKFPSKQALGGHVVRAHKKRDVDPGREAPSTAATTAPAPAAAPIPFPNPTNPTTSTPLIPPGVPYLQPSTPTATTTQQSSGEWLALLIKLMDMMGSRKKGDFEEIIYRSAMESILDDIKLGRAMKKILVETTSKHLAKGVGKALERKAFEAASEEGESEDWRDSLRNAVVEALENYFSKLKSSEEKKSEGGEGEEQERSD